MSEFPERYWPIFMELYESLPRQGPGSNAAAARALALCAGLPPIPAVLDLGCGGGKQTLQLAELLAGTIVAVDSHAPFIGSLRAKVAARGLADRVHPMVGDMSSLDLPPASFDLVWSEGALYCIGLEAALQVCFGLLRPGGYLAFTESVWRREDPPAEVKAMFESEYPTMGWAPDAVKAIRRSGFDLVGQFTLPDEAWWEDFYTPMEARIEELRRKYADDCEALAVVGLLAQEPAMHRAHSSWYAYEFLVARKPE
ncbi:MAG: class I SAM-dependent methyltransferase [Candidatus Sumerlaeia bacterium]|nr:class I SAM-dependent methyltransferase [Candidatus Sumerlaeia bacterium]